MKEEQPGRHPRRARDATATPRAVPADASPPTVRVVLANDHELIREALSSLLEREEGIDVVARVADGLEVVATALRLRPHVVLIDVAMRGTNGIEATRRIVHEAPDVRVLCASTHRERHHVCEAIRAGASGFLLMDDSTAGLVGAVRAVAGGGRYLSPDVADVVLDALADTPSDAATSRLTTLTPRQREVLQLLAEGHGTKRIAYLLGLSPKTISTHREHVMEKLQLGSIAALTKFAIRHGLTDTRR